MPRLGDLLVAAGSITAAQLEDGLRAQVIHGARLGTNLVELGHVGLDDVAMALARRHGMPPALRRHFESGDPDLQERLPAELAGEHLVVPIGWLAGGEERVMFAVRDPLPPPARLLIEDVAGLPPGGLVQAIAPELRVLYFLERIYGIARPIRFLRVRRPLPAAPPPAPPAAPAGRTPRRHDDGFDGETSESSGGTFAEATGHVRSFEDVTGRFARAPEPPGGAADLDADGDLDDALDRALGGAAGAPGARDGLDTIEEPLAADPFEPPTSFHIEETPVEHLLDPPAPGSPRRPGTAPPPPPEPIEVGPGRGDRADRAPPDGAPRFLETLADAPTLGRIALRKRKALSSSGEIAEAAEVASVFAAGSSIEDVARAIRRAQSRGRVGELAVGALRRFGGPGLEAGALFVIRDLVAIGWKGYAAAAPDLALDQLAVPLDRPTVLAAAARERRALLIDGDHGTPLDRALWRALGTDAPGQVAVSPVVIAGAPVGLLYGHAARMAPFAELFAAVTQATASAFARMLRAAQR